MNSTRRKTIVYDGNAFFLPCNLLINQFKDNLMIIHHALTGRTDVKGWSHPSLSPPCSSSFKREVPGCARSSWAAEGRSIQLDFLCQRPRVAVRNGTPNHAQPRHGVACMAPSSRRCPSIMMYSVSVHSAVTFTSLMTGQAVLTLSRPPRRIQRRHRHWRLHEWHGYPQTSPLFTPQTVDHCRLMVYG